MAKENCTGVNYHMRPMYCQILLGQLYAEHYGMSVGFGAKSTVFIPLLVQAAKATEQLSKPPAPPSSSEEAASVS
jgi:hypothetical protein